MTLLEVCEWLETYELFEHYYVGKIDGTQENVLGVYTRTNTSRPVRALGDDGTYKIVGIKLLVHGTKDADETQNLAIALFDLLQQVRNAEHNENLVYFCDLRVAEPLEAGTDANRIYEYVINVDIYTRR